MTELLAFACLILVIFALVAFQAWATVKQIDERAAWAMERQELLERIQRPDRIPPSATRMASKEDREMAERLQKHARAMSQVGQVGVAPDGV